MKIKIGLITPLKNELISDYVVTFLKTDDDDLFDLKVTRLLDYIKSCFNQKNTLFSPILSIIIGNHGYYEVNLKDYNTYKADFQKIVCEISKEVYKFKYEI